ncbi:actin binding protein [Cavenderia fasciculata]|uniref:Dihydropteridine reductase n=1 Tax=Cavenderia fasciculata TaxID=261658 RepID=F4Q8J5_CACFS|nr:actin binding protein [Cavenderia fasciculata]EGG16095.1 actin binding protein [Cavenderia fasciculata]|eukprot:XP_004352420.1 actin binding protein [Cavenderia fasciculata]
MVRLFSSKPKKEKLPENVDNAFQVVLDEAGVPESERKQLMTLDIERKKQLIQSYQSKLISKKDYAKSSKSVHHSPQYFVEALKTDPSKELLTSLRVRLGNQPLKWLKEFIAIGGVNQLIKVLNTNEIKPNKTVDDDYKIAQCLHSFKLIMNNRVGLESVIKTQASIDSIALVLDSQHLKTKIMVSELLAALCVLHAKGHAIVLQSMDNYREVKREKKPYVHLIQGLKNSNPSLQAATFALINTLISSSENVDNRIKVRNQFKRIGIQNIIEELEPTFRSNPDLATQRDLYEQESRWDEKEHIENARGDQSEDNPEQLFKTIRDITNGGPIYPAFVSILKLLLRTVSDQDQTEDQNLSNCLFLEKVLSKLNEGLSPNDDFSQFFGGSMSAALTDIDHVSGDKAILIQKEIEDLKSKNKRATEQIHEKDLLLTKFAKKIKRLEDGIKSGKGREILDEEDELENELVRSAFQSALVGGGSATTKKSAFSLDSDSGSTSNGLSIMRAKAPIGGPSDFLSGLLDDGSDATALANGDAPPLPPGVPPPPPPPGMKAPSTPERCSRAPAQKLKSYQWAKLRTRNITNTFWTKVDFGRFNDVLPYEHIETLFAAAIFEKKEKEKKTSEITVIDPKRAQNVGILLSRFKNVSPQVVHDAIFNLDDKVLDLETINQLIKYIPSKEEFDAISAFKTSQQDKAPEEKLKLGQAEQFFDLISDIPRLSQRIQALHYKLNFPEKLYQAKPDIRIFNQAMNELQNENLFRIMEIILAVGNFINHGTNRGNASGYKIDSINKLADTKSNVRDKYTLVHFLIELVQEIQPELLDFYIDIPSVIEAATLSYSTSTSEIRLLRASLIKIEKEIFGQSSNNNNNNNNNNNIAANNENEKKDQDSTDTTTTTEGEEKEKQEEGKASNGDEAKVTTTDQVEPLDDNDPFKLQLSEFLISAKAELLDTETLLGETEILFSKITKYFGEEPKPIEEFCAIFKRFADTYQMSMKDIEREKELKEKADKRKSEKTTNNKTISKSNSSGKLDLSKVALKSVKNNNNNNNKSEAGSPSTSVCSADEDEEAIREYIKSMEKGGDSPSSTYSSGSEGEGMMDNVLNLIRDGDFRTIRKTHLSKSHKSKLPKPKSQDIQETISTPQSISSASSKFNAEPLDFSESEEEEEEEDEEYDDDDDDEEEDGDEEYEEQLEDEDVEYQEDQSEEQDVEQDVDEEPGEIEKEIIIMSVKSILVFGGSGALGSEIVAFFKNKGWNTISVDFKDNSNATTSLSIKSSSEDEIKRITSQLSNIKIDSIVCAAGGWSQGSIKSEDYFKSVQKMIDFNLSSAVACAYIAGQLLNENGLVVLTGSVAALNPTPGMLGYGITKCATHFIVKSLGEKDSGLPANSAALCLLPVTLDTPSNRSGMPGANFDDWTPLSDVANQLFEWSSNASTRPVSGSLVSVETKSKKTTFATL